ncbi:MAG: DUF6273 domain-containing protein [Oscillospiraceae bacterium]|nr:DUF6273 domain-containing protein [Oscillospiraceae bacterium]
MKDFWDCIWNVIQAIWCELKSNDLLSWVVPLGFTASAFFFLTYGKARQNTGISKKDLNRFVRPSMIISNPNKDVFPLYNYGAIYIGKLVKYIWEGRAEKERFSAVVITAEAGRGKSVLMERLRYRLELKRQQGKLLDKVWGMMPEIKYKRCHELTLEGACNFVKRGENSTKRQILMLDALDELRLDESTGEKLSTETLQNILNEKDEYTTLVISARPGFLKLDKDGNDVDRFEDSVYTMHAGSRYGEIYCIHAEIMPLNAKQAKKVFGKRYSYKSIKREPGFNKFVLKRKLGELAGQDGSERNIWNNPFFVANAGEIIKNKENLDNMENASDYETTLEIVRVSLEKQVAKQPQDKEVSKERRVECLTKMLILLANKSEITIEDLPEKDRCKRDIMLFLDKSKDGDGKEYFAVKPRYIDALRNKGAKEEAEETAEVVERTELEQKCAVALAQLKKYNRKDPYASIRKIGDEIELFKSFGTFGGDGIEWIVLDFDENESRALLLSKDIITKQPYDNVSAKEFEKDDYKITWEDCSLRRYLNGEFLESFSGEEQPRILKTVNKNHNNQWFNTAGGEKTTDQVFFLSIDEVVKYFGNSGQLQNKKSERELWIDDQYNDNRVAKHDDIDSWWLLRSPGRNKRLVANVNFLGQIEMKGYFPHFNQFGVRPALWINLKLDRVELEPDKEDS